MDIGKIVDDIKTHLSSDLLKKEYVEENETNPMFGHCYVASETLWYLIPHTIRWAFSPVCGKDEDGITHWWVENKQTGEIYDITGDQYFSKGKTPPYENGKRASFLTNKPSKRCSVLLDKMNEKISQKKVSYDYF